MIVEFHHVHFFCGDIEKMAAYFRDIFGGKELSREKRPNAIMIRMDVQGVRIVFSSVQEDRGQFDTGNGKRGLDHIGFKVKDIEATLKAVEEKGGRITQNVAVRPGGLKVAFVEGPEGIRIELVEQEGV